MPDIALVETLAKAHEAVRHELSRKSPRKAAKIACRELRQLVGDYGSFWEGLEAVAEKAEDQRKHLDEVLTNVVQFMNDEGAILGALGVEDDTFGAIAADACTVAELMRNAPVDLSRKALRMLREKLGNSAEVICANSKGPVRRAAEWIVSTKGLKIIGGATLSAANAVAFLTPGVVTPHLAPILIPKLAAMAYGSVTVGTGMMGFEVKELTDLFKPNQ